jgi:hypothetical protein
MPKITGVTKNKAAVFKKMPGDLLEDNVPALGVIDDIRFQFTFTFDGEFEGKTTKKLNSTVSYKKHLASSYTKSDDYRPTSAKNDDKNTVIGLSELEFAAAFDEYGDHLVLNLMNKDTAGLNPSLLPPFYSAYGVYFINNNDQFHKHFHCFPTIPAATDCPKAVDLTGRQLQDFSTLMKFLAFSGLFSGEKAAVHKSKHAAARRIWDTYHDEAWFKKLVTADDQIKLETMVKDVAKTLDTKYKEISAEEGAAKKALNLAKTT